MTGSAVVTNTRQSWAILVAMSVAVTIVIFNSSAVNVALPVMSVDLGLSSTAMRLVIVVYSVTFAATLLPAGHLCNRIGARTVLLVGLTATCIGGAVVTGFDHVLTVMIARVVMGIGAAFVMPSTLALVVASASESGRSRAIAVWSAVSVVGAAGGPIAGGFLVDGWGWKYIFVVSAVGSAAMIAVVLVLVERTAVQTKSPVDVRVLALISAAITSFVVGVAVVADEVALGSVLMSISVALGLLARTVRPNQAQSDDSLRSREQRREFFGASVSNMLLFFALAGTLFVLTQMLQFQFGLSPSTAGLAVAPVSVALVLGVVVSTPVSHRFGRRAVIVAGLLIAAAASAALTVFSTSLAPVLVLIFTAGLGVGLALPLVTESMVASVPSHRVGESAAVNDTMQEVGYALGVAVLGTTLAAVYERGLGTVASDRHSLGATLAEADRTADPDLRETALSAFTSASGTAFGVGATFLVVGALVAYRYIPKPTDRARKDLT